MKNLKQPECEKCEGNGEIHDDLCLARLLVFGQKERFMNDFQEEKAMELAISAFEKGLLKPDQE